MSWWSLGCGLLIATRVFAADATPSLDWFKTVAFAGHQTEYSGVFVYQYGNHVETSRITHVVEADGEYERLESLDGPQREIIRHGGQVWSYINHKMVQVDSHQSGSRFPSLMTEQLSTLSGNYQVKELGLERVAGYNAQAVLFQPGDSLRYAHKIWAHSDTGLLLKAAVLGDRNQVVEQYAFSELKIGGEIDRSWVSSSRIAARSCKVEGVSGNLEGLHGASRSIPELNKIVTQAKSVWVVDALPSGFKKTMEVQRPMRGKHAPVTQLVFSDGLSSVSVFIEPVDSDEDDFEGLTSRGAVNLYHKVVGEHLFTVVGEVPPRTVMQVLDSIRYNGK
jgi:sigma-E factor negative regulatory protein RseB